MKILYYTDSYTFDNYGTKRSIFEEVKRRGHDVVWISRLEIGDILSAIKAHNPDQVWLAHSNLIIKSVKSKIKIPVIGFGFSDPYYFSPERFKSYDKYITNHDKTYSKYKPIIPMHYNPTACDFNFHKNLGLPRTEVSLIGAGTHPRFSNTNERIDVVNLLRVNGMIIKVYGKRWPGHMGNSPHISGSEFLRVINRSKFGLDIQDTYSPLAHRMFEYASCGTPIITRDRPEVFNFFERDEEIITYTSHNNLIEKVDYYSRNPDKLKKIAVAAELRCRRDHNIDKRVDGILDFLEM